VNIAPESPSEATEFQTLPQICSGELHVDLVGRESACVSSGGVVSTLCNLATHCSSMSKKEILIFEEHNLVHNFAKIPSEKSNERCSYPFTIYLPGTLPPSMDYDDTQGGGCCSIYYQLTARLVNEKQEQKSAASPSDETGTASKTDGTLNLHAEHTLCVVGATPSTKKYPVTFQPKIYPVKPSLGVLGRGGYIIVAARVENTHVAKGDDLHLSLSCRNRSDHYIQSVDVHLLETIHWNTSTSGCSSNIDLSSQSASGHKTNNSKTVNLASYTGLVLDGLQNGSQDKPHSDSHDQGPHEEQVDPLVNAEMHNDLMSERNTVSIRLPSQARDSYKGKLVQVAHFLRITFAVKNKASDPHVDIPIRVCDPHIEMHAAHPPIPSRKIETIATTKWVEGPDAVATSTRASDYEFEAT